MKTLLRQYVLKKPVLFICLLALRSTPCPSLLCCVLQRPNISKHPYQAPLTTVLSAVFGQWAMLARLWRKEDGQNQGLSFSYYSSVIISSSCLYLLSGSNFCFTALVPGPKIFSFLFSCSLQEVRVASCSC